MPDGGSLDTVARDNRSMIVVPAVSVISWVVLFARRIDPTHRAAVVFSTSLCAVFTYAFMLPRYACRTDRSTTTLWLLVCVLFKCVVDPSKLRVCVDITNSTRCVRFQVDEVST